MPNLRAVLPKSREVVSKSATAASTSAKVLPKSHRVSHAQLLDASHVADLGGFPRRHAAKLEQLG